MLGSDRVGQVEDLTTPTVLNLLRLPGLFPSPVSSTMIASSVPCLDRAPNLDSANSEATSTNNRDRLVKRIAGLLQAFTEGGVSEGAHDCAFANCEPLRLPLKRYLPCARRPYLPRSM